MPEIADVVRISASIRAGGATLDQFGRGLFVAEDGPLSGGGPDKVRVFARLSDVSAVFDSDTEFYKAALAWFSQNPRPKNLLMARWAKTLVPTVITGGDHAALATFTAISNGSLTIDGTEVDGIDFSGLANLAAVATAVQTDIQAEGGRLAAVTVAYTGGAFVVTTPDGSDTGPITAGVAGTNVATHLGLTADDGAKYLQGSAAETISECLDAVEAINAGWYFFALPSAEAGNAHDGRRGRVGRNLRARSSSRRPPNRRPSWPATMRRKRRCCRRVNTRGRF